NIAVGGSRIGRSHCNFFCGGNGQADEPGGIARGLNDPAVAIAGRRTKLESKTIDLKAVASGQGVNLVGGQFPGLAAGQGGERVTALGTVNQTIVLRCKLVDVAALDTQLYAAVVAPR